MTIVRIAIGCAAVALVSGTALSRLIPAVEQGWHRPPAAPVVAAAAAPRLAGPEPGPASFGGPREVIAADPGGQFQADIEIDGRRLPAMIDTGATFLALSRDDADHVGIRPLPSDFRYPVSTANGRAYVAKVQLAAVRLGAITVRDVPALVADRGQMSGSLVGMSFLSRLSTFRIDRGRLVLEQ